MTAAPVADTWPASEFVTDTILNTRVRDRLAFLLDPPTASLKQIATQSLLTVTSAPITFTAEDSDNYNGHSIVTNTSRYVSQVDGWYLLGGVVAFAANATGTRSARLSVTAAFVPNSRATVLAAGASNPTCVATPLVEVFLATGDFVELFGLQDSGGSLSTAVTADIGSRLTVRYSRRG